MSQETARFCIACKIAKQGGRVKGRVNQQSQDMLLSHYTGQDRTRQGGTDQDNAGRQASRQDKRERSVGMERSILKADQLTILTYPAS